MSEITGITITKVRNNHATTSISTSAYTQLVSSMPDNVKSILISDNSGEELYLAIGPAGSEVDQINLPRGISDEFMFQVGKGDRVSVKAITAATATGTLLITFRR